MTGIVLAHVGQLLQPHDAATAWSRDWGAIALLLAGAAVYARGSSRLAARAPACAHAARRRFVGGWIILAVALVSPLHAFGETLLSAHMVQHALLVGAAAPLLVLGRPDVAVLHALPAGWRSRRLIRPVARVTRALLHPVIAAALHTAAIVLGHTPWIYQATLSSDAMHAAQHAAFLGTAVLFWWSVLRSRRAGGYGLGILMLFVVMTGSGVLGAWLAWSRVLWYPAYVLCNPAWGLNPLEDQQLAGLIMWIPGGLAYLVAAVWLAGRWLDSTGRRAVQREARQRAMKLQPLALLVAVAVAGCADSRATVVEDARLLARGEPARGRRLIRQTGCGTCHTVPGVPGAVGRVGPALAGLASRSYVGGVLPNTPENLVQWLLDPPALAPKTAMPKVGLSEQQARDIAAYLYTLR